MILNPLAVLRARRELANSDPYDPVEWASLKENLAEGKSIRRHRRRQVRPQLLREEPS